MKMKLSLAIVAAALSGFALIGRTAEPGATVASQTAASAPEFKNLSDLKWDKILPDFGADSPQIGFVANALMAAMCSTGRCGRGSVSRRQLAKFSRA